MGGNREFITAGIVDNDSLVVKALHAMFEDVPSPVHVLWSVCDGPEALSLCESPDLVPEVLLTDVMMPGMDGFELSRRMRDAHPGTHVVGLTAFRIDDGENRGAASGMSCILRKEASLQEYVQVMAHVAGRADLEQWREHSWTFTRMMLTETETAVLREYLRGRTTAATARLMHMSEGTVKTHVNNAYRKMGVHSRAEAIRICVRERLL
ncbi:response regulator transcription factor [Bifidobacterium sp. 64T4]|uniref:response regulator transcription factor n=1 Tax=Bifidobacterium pongonis TaxID=2834432 RepID=UPI001C5660A2|nr:response regulator transcription factor [Bifidobacterium pongonis]MBW3093768.1 response regulator transcription factor [Bifidobacterium pongonis]MBW3093943.1 response regulator transcription factor [Bifidobacterium pongonis]